jgi:hypothetical protein
MFRLPRQTSPRGNGSVRLRALGVPVVAVADAGESEEVAAAGGAEVVDQSFVLEAVLDGNELAVEVLLVTGEDEPLVEVPGVGPTPGQWEAPECTGPGVVDPLPAVWVPTVQLVAAATPAPAPVDPAVVGAQAVSELVMPSPTSNMAPPSAATQLVNVAAWFWIAPGAWAGLSATATTGPVTAIATAVPVRVVWDMGVEQEPEEEVSERAVWM